MPVATRESCLPQLPNKSLKGAPEMRRVAYLLVVCLHVSGRSLAAISRGDGGIRHDLRPRRIPLFVQMQNQSHQMKIDGKLNGATL
jgi:hypothetical protein